MNVALLVTSLWTSSLLWNAWRYSKVAGPVLWQLAPLWAAPSTHVDDARWDQQQRSLEQLHFQVLALSRELRRREGAKDHESLAEMDGAVAVTSRPNVDDGDVYAASWRDDDVDQEFVFV